MTGGGTLLPVRTCFSAVFLTIALPLVSMRAAHNGNSPFGVWRGESICTAGGGSCHDEKVVYHIEPIPFDAGAVFIRADKIVDGKAITMGRGPWKYDRSRQTLSMEFGQRLWLLTVKQKKIEGVLTAGDGVVFRRMTLTRDDACDKCVSLAGQDSAASAH
jgi:hypothetical protein